MRRHFTLHTVAVNIAIVLTGLASCDSHEAVDASIYVGHVLCADHRTMSIEQYEGQHETEAVAVVFAEADNDHPALAVMLNSISDCPFADSLGTSLGTSGAIDKFDGYTNTVAMMNNRTSNGYGSPLADFVFRNHKYGQSDYIPSVAEMRLLVLSKNKVNDIIRRCGGELLSEAPDSTCWYWTSTEVKENIANQAWLCSMATGGIQQTPKDEVHPARAIVALYY